MSDQNNSSNKSVMYAAFGFAALVVLLVAFGLMQSYTPSGKTGDPSADERILPVGGFTKRNSQAPQVAEVPETNTTADAPKTPTELYASFCHVCHETGVAGAPKKGDNAAWAPRIATGIEALYQSALTGKAAMPPRGNTVNATDDEIKATVDYLVGEAS